MTGIVSSLDMEKEIQPPPQEEKKKHILPDDLSASAEKRRGPAKASRGAANHIIASLSFFLSSTPPEKEEANPRTGSEGRNGQEHFPIQPPILITPRGMMPRILLPSFLFQASSATRPCHVVTRPLGGCFGSGKGFRGTDRL